MDQIFLLHWMSYFFLISFPTLRIKEQWRFISQTVQTPSLFVGRKGWLFILILSWVWVAFRLAHSCNQIEFTYTQIWELMWLYAWLWRIRFTLELSLSSLPSIQDTFSIILFCPRFCYHKHVSFYILTIINTLLFSVCV